MTACDNGILASGKPNRSADSIALNVLTAACGEASDISS